MTLDPRQALLGIKRFDQLIVYLRDELGWPISRDSFDDVDDLFYDFSPEELGIDPKTAAKIQEIKRLRPLSAKQPWGIFFVKFEPKKIPQHDVLLAGFPCQPFSIAGISKKISLNRPHGFRCEAQGTLFFDVARIIKAKRPAAFLEDMTVPPENLGKFFTEIKALLKNYNLTAAVHGHGGNGHFHFYPLMDFTNKTTPKLVVKMAEEFFNVAIKYKGNICGEHNDGIIRTPHLSKIFSKKMLDLFKVVEHIFDPDDIFNPGKKVNPRFDIKDSIRHTN
jgi:hypothetical protein